MLKAEELKLLDQIDALIKSADAGDYIPMTFAGIVEVCRRNIENDFGDSPVQDLEDMRIRVGVVERDRDEKSRMLSESQKMCKEALDNVDHWEKRSSEAESLADEWEEHAHSIADELADANKEIARLKAEIAQIRIAQMTTEDMAELYDYMKGAKNNG